MPHLRDRSIIPKLLKRLKYFPVLAIQGARQTGKSVLARELIQKKMNHSKYLSFDQHIIASHASDLPQSFLEQHSEFKPLILDEAQKVPIIFDAVKYQVDQERQPGQFILLGSTEFSILTRIRESLTGRMGRVRLFPFNLKEALGHHLKGKPTRKQVLSYLKTGGMPAIYSVRDTEARDALFEDWLRLTCDRDLHQFKKLKLDSELAYQILIQCAKLEEPNRPNIARTLNTDGRKVETHLKALCHLFVLQRIPAHPSGKGKPLFHLLDPGVAGYLGASIERKLQILVMNERLTKNAYSSEKLKTISFYRSNGKKLIHWIEEAPDGNPLAIQCLARERILKTDALLMKSFLDKNPKAKGYVLAPIPEPIKIQRVSFRPWEDVSRI